jgi:hypothetical protein
MRLHYAKKREVTPMMNDRTEFNKKATEILDFFDTYEILRIGYLEKFFPNSQKVVDYLVKHKRLHKNPDGNYISTSSDISPDKTLVAALGLLGDVLEKVKTHAKAVAPAQLSFLTHSGDYYEIIYVSYGMEAMVEASFEAQLAAKQRVKGFTDSTKRMVIVEDENQIELLQIPGTTRFAHVKPDGRLIYYKGRN